jgi:hypothetical protein
MGGIYQHCPSDYGMNVALMMAWSSLLERYDSGVLIYANYWSTAQIIGVIFETLAT